ncbi:hypothetical protein P3T76_008053 [Phytophthora citrophthora]|uniref:Uncharacterized protein n=1 Tax=Phytophthora citrophthora TaxID=4793 RepID=A0AAD9GLE4_9STRA|nr:hypothetical protein P3T76_008053 [Phytophthora citrophthora]
MEDSCERNWDFLAPWCRGLHCLRYEKGSLGDVPIQRFRGIAVELPNFCRWSDDGDEQVEDDGKPPCQDLREALGLLSAVAHVDNAAWKKLLLEQGKIEVKSQEEQLEGKFMPRFQLARIDSTVDTDEELLKGMKEFCGTEQYTAQSTEYKQVLTKISDMNYGKKWTGSTEIEIPVTVHLGPWLASSTEGMLVYLRKIQETIREIREQWQQYVDQERKPLSVVFVLESLMVDIRDVKINEELAELMESLAHDGIRMSGLALRQELWHHGNLDETRKNVGKLMFALFGGTKKAAAIDWSGFDFEVSSMTGPLAAEYGHGNQLSLSSVHFECEAMQNWVFERMCSAVAVNQTTKHLSVEWELNGGIGDDDYRDWRRRWQWIVFACFSEKARLHSRLESLNLCNAVITTNAVEAMAAVLASDTPEEDLLYCSSSPSEASIDVCIKPNSSVKLSSMPLNDGTDNSPSFKMEREISGVTLLSEGESDWVEVLIPGFGKCQVGYKCLAFRQLTLPTNGLAGVTSLDIKFREDPDPEVLQGLLLLVGASLTHLSFTFEDFHTMELEGIVASCPNLVELAVSTYNVEMRFNLRDNNFRDLVLDSPSHISFRDIEDIANALCDPENPLTKCARRMRVRLDQRAFYLPYDAFYTALLKMLKVNRTLEYLDIVAQGGHMNYFNDFKAHHLEALPVERIAFSMECKVAFLSVMGAHRSERGDIKRRRQLPLPVLDQHVIRCIFEYASPNVTRRVYFRDRDFFETGRYFVPI